MNNEILVHNTEARDAILSRVRAGMPGPVAYPEIPLFPYPGDPLTNFKEKLVAFCGEWREFASRREAIDFAMKEASEFVKPANGGKPGIIYSSLPDMTADAGPETYADDPHLANEIKVAVCDGEFGVGETGSVYVTDESLGLVAAPLFSLRLYLLLDKTKILPSLQEAYRELGAPAVADPDIPAVPRIATRQYGSFFTGPSATADIEAVHITGAQAELALTVFLY